KDNEFCRKIFKGRNPKKPASNTPLGRSMDSEPPIGLLPDGTLNIVPPHHLNVGGPGWPRSAEGSATMMAWPGVRSSAPGAGSILWRTLRPGSKVKPCGGDRRDVGARGRYVLPPPPSS